MMGFLRRLLGGGETHTDEPEDRSIDQADFDTAEREHELEMLRADQERLDELTQRQLRYAKYAWEPPAQGGEKRAEDNDSTGSGG
jgi:hypothetical protein